MLVNKNYNISLNIVCPSCNTIVSVAEVQNILQEGFLCNSCNYRTDSQAGGIGLLVVSLLKNGRKIEAIKLYRAFTNKSLKESKKDVELIAQKYGIELKSGCFIATACFENYDAPEVLILRKYRDEVLSKSIIGRYFIKVYYLLSPRIAYKIQNSTVLKQFVKKYMLLPISKKISKSFNKK